jgi:triose/dihydroxyacetone kinase / FAD-AMP lyase (cyclizing)
LRRIQEVGGAHVGDRTMIDALEPALDALSVSLEKAAIAARTGADSTAKMLKARAGRATYVSENHLAGFNDPGAEAVAILFGELFETAHLLG